MASNHIMHFADPHHSLVKTEYSRAETGLCNICLLKLAGHEGYGCYTCNIHVHRACAGYFGEIISFFAHQPHSLRLSRSPGRICDICRGDCPRESLVYSCIGCGFDVHPLCAVLPERVANPSRPGHELCMVSSESPGSCSACSHPLLRWRYICSSRELHVACAIDPSTCAGQGSKGPAAIPGSYDTGVQGSHGLATQRSFGGQGWYQGPVTPGYNGHPIQAQGYGFAGQGSYYGVPVIQGGYGPPPIQGSSSSYPHAMPCGYGSTSSSGQSVFNSPTSLMTAIARFLAGIAINEALSELASQILSGGFNN